ncbi:MAG: YciI family protein [Tenuifilaceae bacterium]
MNKLAIIVVILAFFGCSNNTEIIAETQSVYDSTLAKKLGADDLGMRKYVMAFLKRGTVKIADSTERMNLQMAHLKNIQKMADEGKLVIAGPFLDDQEIRGIYIFNVETIDEAKALTETDPAIIAGTLVMDLHPWYGSAGLMEINTIHSKIQKKGFGE